ncbi:unnamed protein product [Blepharisma stoltei]|uniref:Phosphodiesterase n=1 Tax=Blepharisma stoltei TaxID=1481888 RepID=A0AAU9I9T4_9CILI|nr:unnamed protein product [Blepharisma stoltei]
MKSPDHSMRSQNPLMRDGHLPIPSKDINHSGVENSSSCHSETTWQRKQLNVKFYLCYYCLLSVCLGNSLVYYSVYNSSANFLFLSIILLIGSILFSLAIMIMEVRIGSSHMNKYMLNEMVYLFVGLSIVFSDPNIVEILIQTDKHHESFVTSFMFLMILGVIAHKNLARKIRQFIEVNVLLGLITFILNMFGELQKGQTIFQFILFILLTFYLATELQSVESNSMKLAPDKSDESIMLHEHLEQRSKSLNETKDLTVPRSANTTIEEIVSSLVKSFDLLSEVNSQDISVRESIQKSSQIILSALETLRTSSNVYSTNLKNITKNLDEQDKMFIEQSFIDANKSAGSMHSSPPVTKRSHKDPLYTTEYGVPELMGILIQIGKDWNFNTFLIDECTKGAPLLCCGVYALRRYGLDEIFSITDQSLKTLLQTLESKYYKNPYHNSCHAADVMNSYLFLIQASQLVDEMSSLELISGILAALAHDVGHPAKNNRFLIMSNDDLAIQFNDISVLEMLHASTFFKILKAQEPCLFKSLQLEKWHQMRKLIIELILATDMGKHFELMGYFNSKYLSMSELPELSDPEFRLDQYKMAIKAADIGHAAKSVELHQKWCGLAIKEFFAQGELEKSLGIPVSMYCDKDTTDISKSQAGFIKNIVSPLFMALNKVMNSQSIEDNCIAQLKINEGFWNSKRSYKQYQTVLMRKDEENEKSRFDGLVSRSQIFRHSNLAEKYLS